MSPADDSVRRVRGWIERHRHPDDRILDDLGKVERELELLRIERDLARGVIDL